MTPSGRGENVSEKTAEHWESLQILVCAGWGQLMCIQGRNYEYATTLWNFTGSLRRVKHKQETRQLRTVERFCRSVRWFSATFQLSERWYRYCLVTCHWLGAILIFYTVDLVIGKPGVSNFGRAEPPQRIARDNPDRWVWCDQDWENHQETRQKGSVDLLILKRVVWAQGEVKVCTNFCDDLNVCTRQASSSDTSQSFLTIFWWRNDKSSVWAGVIITILKSRKVMWYHSGSHISLGGGGNQPEPEYSLDIWEITIKSCVQDPLLMLKINAQNGGWSYTWGFGFWYQWQDQK